MRLLMVATSYPPVLGGIQTYAHELALRLAPRVEELVVVTPRADGDRDFDAAAPHRIVRVPKVGDDLALSGIAPIATVARRGRYDTVFATHWAAAHGALRARRAGYPKRVFCAAHAKELLLRPLERVAAVQRAYDRVRAHALRHSDGFFPVSRYTAGLLEERGVRPDKITTVPNGVDPEKLRPGDGERIRREHGLGQRPVLLTVARLVRRKGIDTVLAALPAIAEAVPEVLYVVVGDGPDRVRLDGLAREHGVTDRVRMLGKVDGELRHYYSAGDIFVMPARTEAQDAEGFGLVFFEASACERPVVGARAGGVPDAIVEGRTGLLVEPDDPAALAEALIGLLRDRERAEAMGRAGRAHVLAKGTWDRAAQRIFEALSR